MAMSTIQKIWFVMHQQKRRTKSYTLNITGTASVSDPTAGTLVFSATEDLVVTSTGDVTVSTVISNDALFEDVQLRLHTVTIECPQNGSGTIAVIGGNTKIVSLGNHGGDSNPNQNFCTGLNATAPILHWDLNKTPATVQRIRQATAYTTILPTTGSKALPTGLTYLVLLGNNIAWTYTGAMPTGLTVLLLIGANIAWTYTGAMPTGLTVLYLDGAKINWTGTVFGRVEDTPKPTFTTLNLSSHCLVTRSVADIAGLFDSMDNNMTLPAASTIGNVPDMQNTTQDGHWGDFSGVADPSALAISLKSIVMTKGKALTLNTWGCTYPTAGNDGVGFPENFGLWWLA